MDNTVERVYGRVATSGRMSWVGECDTDSVRVMIRLT